MSSRVGVQLVRRRRIPIALFAAGLVVLALLAVFAIELSNTQAKSKQDVEARVHERAVLAAALVDSLFQTVAQEVPQDEREFGARVVSNRVMDSQQEEDSYLALLDSSGAVIASSPGFTAQARRDLSRSSALAMIRSGHPYALGNLLPYGKNGVIDLAVAFPTRFGERILFSGFSPAALGPLLGGELREIPGVQGARNYLIDSNDTVLASNDPARPIGYRFTVPAQVQA
jgi:hypothetical protein